MTEMFGEAWSPMSVPDLAPDDDDDDDHKRSKFRMNFCRLLITDRISDLDKFSMVMIMLPLPPFIVALTIYAQCTKLIKLNLNRK